MVWRAIAVQMRLRRSSLNSADAAGWEEMNAFERLAPSTSKRLSFERSSLVVAKPRSCISVLRVTVSGLILLRAGIFLERIRANAVERRQWITVVGEVCSLVYSRAEAIRGVVGMVMPLMGKDGNGLDAIVLMGIAEQELNGFESSLSDFYT